MPARFLRFRSHHTCFSPSPNTKYTEGKKKKTSESGSAAEHSSDTLLVSNLPFHYINSQLEEAFSDIGPIRRSFKDAEKETFGPEHHLIVSFALDDVQISKLQKAKLSSSAAGKPLRFSGYAGKGRVTGIKCHSKPKAYVQRRDSESNRIDEVKNKDPDRKFLKEHVTKKRKRNPGAEDKTGKRKHKAKGPQRQAEDQGREPDTGSSVNREKKVEPFKEADLGKRKRKFPNRGKHQVPLPP
ncbi:hypothetical protein SADUNF_Sadunf04G0114000 [Salix dunnii]|uniref:RRM domain-containing protein n=1 Tax=Salix dunnii TaxID=1413687 RepID=A0A835N2W9_9ROSI|nr:hypothetical protein SADUNF_Sadunf04G0114000 [Salix dunnii]